MQISIESKTTVAGIKVKHAIVLLAEDDYDYRLLALFRNVLDKHNKKERKRNETLTLWECSYEPMIIKEPFQLKIAGEKVPDIINSQND